MPEIKYSNNPNSDTAFIVQDGGQKNRVLLTAEPEGSLSLSDSANVSTGYVTDGEGKKHKVNLVSQLEGDVELPENPNSTKGYVTVDGQKHRVILTASLHGGGSAPVIDELNVTPTTSAQTITAPEGTDGYSPVNVSAVTSAIDANITAGNIKKDVSILGVTGTYEGAKKFNADINVLFGNLDANGILQEPSEPTDLVFTGMKGFVPVSATMGLFFRRFQNLTSLKTATFPDLKNINVPYGFGNAFYNCQNLQQVDYSALETIDANTEYAFSNAFSTCPNLAKLDFSGLKTINSTSQYSFNYGCAGCYRCIDVDFSSLQSLTAGYDFYYFMTSTTSDSYTVPKVLKFGSLTTVSGLGSFMNSFSSARVGTIDFHSLKTVSGKQAFQQAFQSNPITSITFDALDDISGIDAFAFAFSGTTHGSNTRHIYFPAVKSTSFGVASCFRSMINQNVGTTLHFPSNLDPSGGSTALSSLQTYPNFGGTNTILSFDLPATE